MRSTTFIFAISALVVSVSSTPVHIQRRAVDPALVPEFGHPAGLNPTGTGDCDGITNAAGQVVKIPCFCPPDRGEFLRSLNANVDAGRAVNNPGIAVSFPTDNSKASQLTRMQAALVTLQNLRGPGAGCPAAATTFLAQQRAIQDGPDNGPAPAPQQPAPAPAPPAPAPAPAPPAGGVNPALVPEFGHPAGLNPTGTGDCDGIRNAAGQVVKIPCACPPNRNDFITSLNANVGAGFAVNNPSVRVSFPTDNSKESQLTRMQAALVTLQNLRGPGVGCPAASTTFLAQQQAIQNA
ncbi:hypothetical protein FA15DRAFT_128013 [Coprinopsis marcescibilis]|uniref:Uncharacterized protein n=1 Tax=Coprinopsis marcescibilis TaxID=230819 RepID=A0A5C3KKH3_COPMA|nr:hypothetical protein FA15DRAFT_128013 [Coprinopsis marcescibilis]